MFAWGLVQRKIIGLVRACLGVGAGFHLLLPKRCTISKCGYWMTDKDSTSLFQMEAMEGTNHRFSSVSDAKFPDVCPMEQSNNTLKHSWHSRKIREFERYNETLRLEVMMVEQKLEVITEL
ncbi:hypothetical protein PAHAL_3G374600 [Panicum hallii]|uniref:Uncharacterized protein n=1 Tax=Panicum hallii TaxID=206008 RepID=A0A2T8KKJ6_9POAL|nr:hypothetical protein PAHAL_3G374600 [Panicum hallii]